MSFQAYLDTIKAKTGKTPIDLRDEFSLTGKLQPDMKAGELVTWLKTTYGLGHGHCMAIWNVFVKSGWVETKHTKLNKKK
jgi:Domain of unknown function (DUF4287)